MKRIYDVVEEVCGSWKYKLINDVKDISDLDMSRYDMLGELGATNSKTYKDLQLVKKMNNKRELKRTLDLCNRYSELYPYDAFIQKTELDDICKKHNYLFGSISMYSGEIKDLLSMHILRKKNLLDENDSIFYLEDSSNNKAGFFSMAEIIEQGYEDETRFYKEKAEIKVLAPIALMELQKWSAHPEPKSTGCAAFLHVVRGYLQICSF